LKCDNKMILYYLN